VTTKSDKIPWISVVEAISQGLEWIRKGGNFSGLHGDLDDIPVDLIIRRKGFVPPDGIGDLEELAKARPMTLEAFHCALTTAEIDQIDGLPRSYMQFPVTLDRIDTSTGTADSDVNIIQEKIVECWSYKTLCLGSHLSDPVARVELLSALLKVIKNASEQLRCIVTPLVVWRTRPEFSVDTDQGITYLRCRLFIPGVKLASIGGNGEEGVFWVEGV
jgi:hypothetical protein